MSASSETTSYGVFARRWWMKLDGMKPAPPVTSTFLATAADYVFRPESNPGTCSTLAGPSGNGQRFQPDSSPSGDRRRPRLFVDALALLLGHDDRLEVIGTAEDGPTAIELAVAQQAEVAVIDVRMPDVDGSETAPASADAQPRDARDPRYGPRRTTARRRGQERRRRRATTKRRAARSAEGSDHRGSVAARSREELNRSNHETIKAGG